MLQPGDPVEYQPNVFHREKRYRGEVAHIEGDCIWVRVKLKSGREIFKIAHRQWLKPLLTGETTCRS